MQGPHTERLSARHFFIACVKLLSASMSFRGTGNLFHSVTTLHKNIFFPPIELLNLKRIKSVQLPCCKVVIGSEAIEVVLQMFGNLIVNNFPSLIRIGSKKSI